MAPERSMADQPPDRASDKRRQDDLTAYWYRLAGIGMEFIVAVLLLGGIGWWLDRLWGTLPWLMLVGGALGFALGLWLMVRAAMRSFR